MQNELFYTNQTTSVLANLGSPMNDWSCGERLHTLVKPPAFFLTPLSTLADLLHEVPILWNKTKNVYKLDLIIKRSFLL